MTAEWNRADKQAFLAEAKARLHRRYPDRRPRLLVIEDDDGAKLSIVAVLEALGCEIVEAGDMATAEALLDNPAEVFDMILVNLTLPPRPGYSPLKFVGLNIIRTCRSNSRLKSIPTPIITGFDSASPELYDAMGGDEPINPKPPVLEKPFTLESCRILLTQFQLPANEPRTRAG